MSDASAPRRAEWPVVLVCMPFMDDRRPSLQAGLLSALATAHGFPATTLHANLDFAAGLGVDMYRALADDCGRLVGDWLFSLEAFGSAAPDPHSEFLDLYAEGLAPALGSPVPQVCDRLLRIRRDDVPAYLDALVEAYPWDRFRVAGFTSTFQQNAASMALARRLKRRYPDLFTLFGGANFDAPMGPEWVRTVESIDAAVIGEADVAFPMLLSALADGSHLDAVPGLARRKAGNVVTGPPAQPVRSLDDLPMPDYDEYFQRAENLRLQPRSVSRAVDIPLETARGCWWGMRHHCTFCGLNGEAMHFRSKSAGRVLEEFAHQARRYGSFRFEAVDNILDTHYFRTLFPALVESGAHYEIFYEVKANLSRAQIKLLADAGVSQIQPGIESLNSHVLSLMRKGVTAAQNVNLLRWARHYGMDVRWNLLWGFPGESPKDSSEQAAAIRDLWHLTPPGDMGRLIMERFSPLFSDQDKILRDLHPAPGYARVYPADIDLDLVAYFFRCEIEGALPDADYRPLREAVADWRGAWQGDVEPPVLEYRQAPHYVQIHDGRRKEDEGTYVLEGPTADLYLACCDRPVTATAVHERLGLRGPVERVQQALDEFAQAGLVFRDGPRNVALAVPVTRP
ncbi:MULTISPECIES: RiPP maturation radical SAM C-methyltransferase [Streptomyces]|uniref:RiPP maturation radical SAM C-methyltransferase n=1 Tax=Streptomyces ortus TaxID=2867268 RepID=A0ABT3V6J0_9ACTN|nr:MULTISPECIES: RiPP maturation radical SAM C-methyltransferase [Streptomyces]MCX4235161.1 RiPP maturation radical SAM C-methyltransferase [Streptomyces ortus]